MFNFLFLFFYVTVGFILLLPFSLTTATTTKNEIDSRNPVGKIRPTNPGEIWSAFFAMNSSASSCSTTDTIAEFYVARWIPNPPNNNDNPTQYYYISQPYTWPTLTPIHSKSLTWPGTTMAVDSINRRGWAYFGTTDWSNHVYFMELSFPSNNFNSTNIGGLCELMNVSISTINLLGLYYNSKISTTGPFYLNPDFSTAPFTTNVSVINIPPFNPKGKSIPACTITNVSGITDTAFVPNQIPSPVVGTTSNGIPVTLMANTNINNSSQITILAWSLVTGRLIYNQTFACGYPSYLYSCPPTSGANWPLSGLFGFYYTNGTLVIGGGDWSNQQYFQGILTMKDESDDDTSVEKNNDEKNRNNFNNDASIPVLTNLNISIAQGTWFSGPRASTFVTPNKWPINVQYISGGGGTCTPTNNYANFIEMQIMDKTGLWVNNTLPSGFTVQPGCPLLMDIFNWTNTAFCSGASIGYPDQLNTLH